SLSLLTKSQTPARSTSRYSPTASQTRRNSSGNGRSGGSASRASIRDASSAARGAATAWFEEINRGPPPTPGEREDLPGTDNVLYSFQWNVQSRIAVRDVNRAAASGFDLYRAIIAGSRAVDVLLGGPFAELLHAADVDLAHPLLGDSEVLADLFQRHFLRAVQADSHANHIAGPRIEVVEQMVDASPGSVRGGQHLLLIRADIRLGLEHILMTRDVTLLVRLLVRNRTGVVFHDCPGGVSAELEAAAVIELLHGPHERQIAVADQV